MKKNNTNRLIQLKNEKCRVEQNGNRRHARYNITDMREDTTLMEQGFAQRLSKLRMARNISAREMSLSIGQGAGYINNIESGNNLPSMGMFFEICEYLKVSPSEFFDYEDSKGLGIEINNQTINRLSASDKELVKSLMARLIK